MTDLFHTDDGTLVTNLSGFTTRTEARTAGFRWLAAILTHDASARGNERELRERRAVYEAEGWALCGWGTYGQDATPEEDAREAARLSVEHRLAGWIADGEDWAEGPNRGYSQRFIDEWQKAGAPVPLAVAPLSSETDQFVRLFDYQAWLNVGSMVMPQVYGNDIPTLTVEACLAELKLAGVPQSETSLMLGTYSQPIPFVYYQGWSGPRVVYLGDRTPADAWARLARDSARPGTPPEEEKPVPPIVPPEVAKPKPLTPKQVPYTGPYAKAGNAKGIKSSGPTVEAMKRALSRAGAPTLPWRDFSQEYNANLEAAWDWYGPVDAPNLDGYGDGRWKLLRLMMCDPAGPNAGQRALDLVGRTLIQNEAGATSDSGRMEKFQGALTAAARRALKAASRWRYDAHERPVELNIDVADPPGTSDCSGSVIQLSDRARRDAGLLAVIQDPAKQNWSGFGNTDQFEDDWPKVTAPYRVGDLAHFANPGHVILCIVAGDANTARWWSFGHEPPEELALATYRRFPGDFRFVVRPAYIL